MNKHLQRGYRDILKEKRGRRKIRVAFLVASSLIALVVFMVYSLFFSGWFSVENVLVIGNLEISEEQVKNLADNYLNKTYLLGYIKPFSNILFTSSEKIEHSLRNNFPIIGTVDIDKKLFSKTLSVEIKEREILGIWCGSAGSPQVNQDCFYFDKEMVLFKSAPRVSGDVFLVIEDGRDRNFNLADSFDDRELFEKVNLTRNILDEINFIAYDSFFLPQGSFEFWIKSKEGWYIYLDKETDVPNQLVALKKFLEEKLPAARRQSLQYIDLRINNRIYYK